MRLNPVVWMRKSPYTGICIVSTVVAGTGLTFLQPVTADWSTANTHLVTKRKTPSCHARRYTCHAAKAHSRHWARLQLACPAHARRSCIFWPGIRPAASVNGSDTILACASCSTGQWQGHGLEGIEDGAWEVVTGLQRDRTAAWQTEHGTN